MMQKWKFIGKKYIYFILIGLLFMVFIATRLWRNMIIPNGLHIDEAGMAYDAWSLANYGVDRHLKSWPIYLINFGGGQSILYCYLCAVLFKIFGFSLWLVRFPAVFFSFLTFVFGMLIVRKIFPDKPFLVFVTGGVITVCPFFILASRLGLDCNLMLGMSTVFLYCFVCAMENERYLWYILAGIMGGLVLYTYAISYLVLPVFLFLALFYAIWVRKFSFARWLSMAIPMGFLAFPLILEQYINAFDLEEIELGIFTATKLQGYRISEVENFHWKNFVKTIESVFIGDSLPYNSISGYPTLYYVTIPLAILGVLRELVLLRGNLKKRDFSLRFYPLFWLLAMLLAMGCINMVDTNTGKVNGIFFVVIFLVAEGIDLLLAIWKRWGKIVVAFCGVLYCVGFVRFGTYYYFLGGYSSDYHSLVYFDVTVAEAVEFLEENPQYKHLGAYMAEEPIFFAISTLASPYDLMLAENEHLLFDYYYCGSLPRPEDGYNYIVRDIYPKYAETLRSLGYTEIQYNCYSLFYQEEYQ